MPAGASTCRRWPAWPTSTGRGSPTSPGPPAKRALLESLAAELAVPGLGRSQLGCARGAAGASGTGDVGRHPHRVDGSRPPRRGRCGHLPGHRPVRGGRPGPVRRRPARGRHRDAVEVGDAGARCPAGHPPHRPDPPRRRRRPVPRGGARAVARHARPRARDDHGHRLRPGADRVPRGRRIRRSSSCSRPTTRPESRGSWPPRARASTTSASRSAISRRRSSASSSTGSSSSTRRRGAVPRDRSRSSTRARATGCWSSSSRRPAGPPGGRSGCRRQ